MKELLEILTRNQVHKTVLPSLNLWLFYIIICLVIWAIFNVIVAGLVFAFGPIFISAQNKETKEDLHCWWHNKLPLLKFHAVCVFLELGVLIYLVSVVKLVIPSTLVNNNKKYAK